MSQKNDLEQRVEEAGREIQVLCDQHNSLLNQHNFLLSLKQKAENKLRDARHIQEKLLMEQSELKRQNQRLNLELNDTSSSRASDKNFFENDSEVSLRDLEDTSGPSSELQENLFAQVNVLQQKLNFLRNSNDSRNELIQVLDNREAQLQSDHQQNQEKLMELQNKKRHADRAMSQLQNFEEDADDEDIGAQVRKICHMKQQLSKLKDMYELVKNTESAIESQNMNDSEDEENAQALPLKADNVIQNCVKGNGSPNKTQTERTCNKLTTGSSKEKNKKASVANAIARQPDVTNQQIVEFGVDPEIHRKLQLQAVLQAELQAKKRELEEIMCKHKGKNAANM